MHLVQSEIHTTDDFSKEEDIDWSFVLDPLSRLTTGISRSAASFSLSAPALATSKGSSNDGKATAKYSLRLPTASTLLFALVGPALCLWFDSRLPIVLHYALCALSRGGVATGFSGIDFWCVGHAVLDVMYFKERSCSALYFPIHVACHMSLAIELRAMAVTTRLRSKPWACRACDAIVGIKFAAVIVTTLREMGHVTWVNPSCFAALGLDGVPPVDDMIGAVAFMTLATIVAADYGVGLLLLHLISARVIGPCAPGQIACRKNTFNNMLWHFMTCFLHSRAVSRQAAAATSSWEDAGDKED